VLARLAPLDVTVLGRPVTDVLAEAYPPLLEDDRGSS
jgi:hypothetical protein